MPNDLNLRWSQRPCVALAGLFAAFLGLAGVRLLGVSAELPWPVLLAGVVLFPVIIAVLNRSFYRFLASKRGAWFAMSVLPLHILYYLYSGVAFLLGLASYLMTAAGSVLFPKAATDRAREDLS